MKFKLICVDGTYTGILNGNIFVSENLTTEQVTKLVSNPTEEEIIEIFNPKLQEIRDSNAKVQELIDVLLESGLFEERNGSYYRVGNPVSVPKMLLEKYQAVIADVMHSDTTLEALDNFWLKCSLNPDSRAREDLFWFLQKWGFTITPKGYFVAYRNVDIKNEGNRQLHDFVALQYTQVKAQKKAPKNYTVAKVGENLVLYTVNAINQPTNPLGNLQEMYNNLAELSETVYTDNYSKKFNIKIGEPVTMDRKDCDPNPNNLCSRALHVGAAGWLKHNYCGTQGIVVLVNPQQVVAVPPKDSYGKMRLCEYVMVGLAEFDEDGNIIPLDTTLYEDDYEQFTIEELNKLLQEIDSSNQVIHQLTFSEVPNQVYKSIDEYRLILESKNQSIYPDIEYRDSEYDEDDDNDPEEWGDDDYDEDDNWDSDDENLID